MNVGDAVFCTMGVDIWASMHADAITTGTVDEGCVVVILELVDNVNDYAKVLTPEGFVGWMTMCCIDEAR